MAKAFDSVWVDGLLYELLVFNFSSYLVKPYLPSLVVGS